jgi:hypothetical protein
MTEVAWSLPDPAAWRPEDWSALGTVVTAVVAVVAGVVAVGQLREARRLRKAQSQPFVYVDIQLSRTVFGVLHLVIENTGTTLARDVRMSFTPALRTSLTDSELPGGSLLREGISVLPPRRRLEVIFDYAAERDRAELPTKYEVVVIFSDSFGKELEPLTYVVDFGHIYEAEYVRERSIDDMARALDEISKSVQGWSSGSRALHAWVRDEDAKYLRERAVYDLSGRRPSLGRPSTLPELVVRLGSNVLVRTVVRSLRRAAEARRQRRAADSVRTDVAEDHSGLAPDDPDTGLDLR